MLPMVLVGVVSLWAAPALAWLTTGWGQSEQGWTQAVVALVALSVAARGWRVRAADPPAIGVALALFGPWVPWLAPRLDAVYAAGALFTSWGVLSWWMPPDEWRRRAALPWILTSTLPVLPVVDAWVGWPLRKLTAQVAAQVLGGLATETVIALEGAVAQVDVPCAGLRGAWSVTALAGLLVLYRRTGVGPRELAAITIGLIVGWIGNLGRIITVVGLTNVDLPLVADTVHLPLGVVSFAAGLATTWALLGDRAPRSTRYTVPRGPASVLVIASIGLSWVQPPLPPPPPPDPLTLPASWVQVPPTEAERAFVEEHGGQLHKGTLGGASVSVVSSRSWAAHHVPTWCLAANGWVLTEESVVDLDGTPVRRVRAERDGVHATAWFWFTSNGRVTDKLSVRVRDGLQTGESWTLVTVLVPDGTDPFPVLHLLRGV